MVVTKPPVTAGNAGAIIPPAAPSRSSSSNSTPKAAKRASLGPSGGSKLKSSVVLPERDQQEPITPQVRSRVVAPGPFSDDVVFYPSPQKSNKSGSTRKNVKAKPIRNKNRQIKRKKQRSMTEIFNLLAQILFMLFTIYSLLVCPKDVKLESPVCRGLTQYRERILDPYVLPPIRAALAHPAVAPQIARAKPYVDQAVQTVQVQYKRLEDASQPYVVLATKEYNRRLRPHVKLMEYNLRRYQKQAQPYVEQSADVVKGWWIKSQPYIRPILLKLQEVPFLAKEFIAKPLGQAKEKWVDPQVKKIVEKVEEMSASVVGEEKEKKAEPPTTFYSSPAASPTDAPAPTPPEDATNHISVDPTSETYTDPLDRPVFNPNYEDDIEDIEFWDEFDDWLHESILRPDGTTALNQPPRPTRLTDEEKAEKRRQDALATAEKRKDIVSRHNKWEEELYALIQTKFDGLHTFLETNRKQAIEDLSGDEGTWKVVNGLKRELAGAIKATEKVLETLEKTKKSAEGTEKWMEKVPVWAGVLEREEGRFDATVEKIHAELSKWTKEWMEAEAAIVEKESEEIMNFAKKASKDLLEDYANLRDITYRDWERYHDLLAKARKADDDFRRLSNGVHPVLLTSMENPVHDRLGGIQREIKATSEQFKDALEEIRRKGWKLIMQGTERKESEGAGWAKKDKEQQFKILPVDTDEDGKPIREEYSRDTPHGDEPFKIENLIRTEAILSKGDEQVREAVRMAEEAKRHEEL